MPVALDPPFDPSTIQTNAKLASALAPSLAIFPCGEAKTPIYGVPWKSARPGQIDRVQKWWTDHPDAMPGIHMGAVGLIGIDADGADGIAAFERICELHGGVPECPMVDTPSGGRHYYFRQRPGEALGNGRGSLPPKSECPVDVRGDGGYLIAPDATREDGVYLYPDGSPLDILQAPELPEWLHDILSGKEAAGKAKEITPEPAPLQAFGVAAPPKEISHQTGRALDMQHPRLRAWVEKAFDDEIQALAQSGRGGRNNQLNTSAFAIFQLVAAGWVAEDTAHTALVQAAEACGLVKDDGRRGVLKTISSARRGGMAQPREVPEEFIRDEEIAASAVAPNRDLAVSADGTLHDAATGEVIEIEEAGGVIPELPRHLLRVPGLVGEIADWIVDTSPSPLPVLAMGAALALIGTLMGRKWFGPTRSSTVLYVLALAPSGSGKEHQIQAMRRMIRGAAVNNALGGRSFTSGPAIEGQVKRQPLTLNCIDEIGAFLKRVLSARASTYEGDIARLIRELWGINDGVWTTTTRASEAGVDITAPHFSIYATGVPEELFEAIGSGDLSNGTMNRFLLLPTAKTVAAGKPALEDPTPPLRLLDAVAIAGLDGDDLQSRWTSTFIAVEPKFIPFASSEVEAAFYQFKNDIAASLKGAGDFRARTAEMALRLATIRAFGLDQRAPSVDANDLAWGVELASWSAAAMEKMCADFMAENETQRLANKVKRAIREFGGRCDRTALIRRLKNTVRARDLTETLDLLKSGLFVAELKVDAGPKGGRKQTIYQLLR